MEPKRRQIAALVAVLVVLAGVVAFQWQRVPSAAGDSTTTGAGRTAGGVSARTVQDAEDIVLHLDDLSRTRPGPDTSERNPFRFEAARPAPTPQQGPSSRPGATVPAGGPNALVPPSPPPGPPPIALKFIGLVDSPGHPAKLAVLSDGRNVFHGREGDIIDGRYRIVRIGVESIEMTYVDGRGRQVIRLSGS